MSDLFKYAGRTFTLDEIRSRFRGCSSPHLAPLMDCGFPLAKWLMDQLDEATDELTRLDTELEKTRRGFESLERIEEEKRHERQRRDDYERQSARLAKEVEEARKELDLIRSQKETTRS